MTKQLPEEVVKIHEKSLRLLDESQEQLEYFREMLRKAVVRLTIAARGEDERLNNVLEQIKSTVKTDIDLDQLAVHLDNLLMQINQGAEGGNIATAPGFYQFLKQGLEEPDFNSLAEPYKTRIQGLADGGLSDQDLSVELLNLVNDLASAANDAGNSEESDQTHVMSFADNVREVLKLDTAMRAEGNVSEILNELNSDIAAYAQKSKGVETYDSGMPDTESDETSGGVKKVLIELLDRLNLPENTSQDHQDICRQLDADLEGAGQWKAVVEDMVALINKSIHVLQDEKKELQSFIKKITAQLAEIEKYVWESRQERIETANESSKLKDSVDTNVVAIQNSVGSADDIAQLKNNVQEHLSEIRKSVEEHQLAEVEREEMSKQGYAHIISELTRTQKETLMLKEQLLESQQTMLRDPLTGLPNRLAYEERINLEVNRFNRNKAPLCLAMWDIDHFKKVNDTYGHEAGDRVLKLLSKIIITRVRKVDMFARIGGEEFVLLMPDTGIDDALNLNNQLRTSLEDSGFHYKGSPCPITASVGIAMLDEYDTHEQLLNKADKALYQSKREGRNRCTIYKHSS